MSGTEPGSDEFGRRVRWYVLRVVPPLIGVAGLIDMLFVRQVPIEPWRLFACLGLIGVIPISKIGDLLGMK